MYRARLPGCLTPSDRVRPRIARSRARTLSRTATTTTTGLLPNLLLQRCSDHPRFRSNDPSYEVNRSTSLNLLHRSLLYQLHLHWLAALFSLVPILNLNPNSYLQASSPPSSVSREEETRRQLYLPLGRPRPFYSVPPTDQTARQVNICLKDQESA